MDDLPAGFVAAEVAARLADLACRFVHPADWTLPPLPPEAPDFADPRAFAALAVAMAPYAMIVFSVGARPAYEDGHPAQWLEWLAREQGYDPGPIEVETGFQHPAVGCWAMQRSDDTVMRMRLALCEDGGRLVMLAAMAPQALWSAVHEPLRTMLRSFQLARPRGGTVPLAPAGTPLPESTFGPGAVNPRPTAPATAAAVGEEPEETSAEPTEQADDARPVPTEDATASDEVTELVSEGVSTYADVACADDVATLLPEHPQNQALLQRGAGFPAPLAADHGPSARCATVKAGALRATLRVPYGWHVLDDSRRTLVHDGRGGVQISLSRRARNGRSAHEFLRDLLADLQQEQPHVTGRRLRCNSVEMLLVHGLVDDDEPLAQAYVLREAPGDEFLVLRCTCRPDDLPRTGNTAQLLQRDAYFLDAAIDGPAWWCEAMLMAGQGQVEAAEQRILRAVDHLGAYASVARMHEERGHRLLAAGDPAGAAAAFAASGDWMDRMAAGATSGGEGLALSLERDEHRARLGLPPYSAR
jgi:hypothetical protein